MKKSPILLAAVLTGVFSLSTVYAGTKTVSKGRAGHVTVQATQEERAKAPSQRSAQPRRTTVALDVGEMDKKSPKVRIYGRQGVRVAR